jgi:uncharacterized membrane protein YqjE
MLHPLFSAIISRPDLAADHVSAYVDLVHEEVSDAGADLVKRTLAWAIAAMSGLLFVVFAGVALMLGLLMNQFHWILIAVPGVMLAVAFIAFGRARSTVPAERFGQLKAQLKNDVEALRSAS